MKSVFKRAPGIVLGVAVVATVVLIALALNVDPALSPAERLAHLQLCLDAFEVVVIGTVGFALGTLIPATFAAARHDFERLKQSRVLYSTVKTGVDYLTARLSALDYGPACAHVQRLHVRKHLSELYVELAESLDGRISTSHWGHAMYERLHDMRDLLERHAGDWDDMGAAERLRLLQDQEAATCKRLEGESDFEPEDPFRWCPEVFFGRTSEELETARGPADRVAPSPPADSA